MFLEQREFLLRMQEDVMRIKARSRARCLKSSKASSLFVSSLSFGLSVQSLICVHSAIPWTAAHQASPSITNSWSLLKLMSIELVMPTFGLYMSLFKPHVYASFLSVPKLTSCCSLCIYIVLCLC